MLNALGKRLQYDGTGAGMQECGHTEYRHTDAGMRAYGMRECGHTECRNVGIRNAEMRAYRVHNVPVLTG